MKINNEKRVFIGIPISSKIKSILPIVKSVVNCPSNQIKWIPIENIHLTLSFVGNISSQNIQNIIQSIKNEITTKCFNLEITGTGVFPSSKSPKVLWLGIGRGINKLKSLRNQIIKSTIRFADHYQEIIFTPHITIAKIRKLTGKVNVLPFMNTVYSPIGFDVNSIYLYESHILAEGVKYSILNAFPLN